MAKTTLNAEQKRLEDARTGTPWRKWGPYLSERQWGTVREDYSEGGDAWNYFTHDQARSRAYRWGEDGLAGISDVNQHLCFALALWNGKDPILKERLVRADQQRGESRRGREGVLLLPRLDADPFLHEVPLQVSAGGVSVRRISSRPTGGARATRWSMSCSTRASSSRTATSTSSWNTPRPVRRTSWCRSPPPIVGRRLPSCTCLPTLWFRNDWASWVAEPLAKPTLEKIEGSAGTRATRWRHIRDWVRTTFTVKAMQRFSLPRMKRTTHDYFPSTRTPPRTSKTASTIVSSTVARRR